MIASLVGSALLVAPPSDAAAKKKKKKPAATKTVDTAPSSAAPEPTPEPTTSTKAAPKAAATPGAEEETPKVADKELSEPSTAKHHPMLDLELDLRAFQRHLSYKDDVFGKLQTYDLAGTPTIKAAVGFFPIQAGSLTAGLTGSFEYAFALGSTYKNPTEGQSGKFKTSAMEYTHGARANFFFGANAVGGGIEYGGQSFAADLPPPTAQSSGIPDVKYAYVRPNLYGRIPLASKLSAELKFGYLIVLSAGEILSDSYFPSGRSKVGGIDGGLRLAYGITDNLEIRGGLDLRHYFYTFKPVDDGGSPYIAGGASDNYYGLSAGVAYVK